MIVNVEVIKLLLVDRNVNKIVNAQAVDKVVVDHTLPKKISRKVPVPQLVIYRPK